MFSRIGQLVRFSTIDKVQPPAAWLPPELINIILAFISGEYASETHVAAPNGFFIDLTRMCRGWYHPVSAYIYANAAPASFQSCELLIRSLENDPQLSFLIKSLTIPKDIRLFAVDTFNVQTPNTVQILVGKCAHLVELRIPMDSAFMWTNDLLHANLPSMEQLSNLRSLEISAFNVIDPSRLRDIAAEYVSMWLYQVRSLPQLERLTLSGVAFTARSYRWPSLPSLRYLSLIHPWCPLGETIPLISQVRGSLKSLHVTGLFEMGSHDTLKHRFEPALISIHAVASTLEELTIISPGPIHHFLLPDLWLRDGLEHMTSLRRLHLSSRFCYPTLLTKFPPLLDSLIITMHGGPGSALDMRSLLVHLPYTVKNLTIKVMGHALEIDYLDVAMAAPFLYPEIETRVKLFESEMYRIADELGINFQMEQQDNPPPCLPKRSRLFMPRLNGTIKFFKRLRLSKH